MDFFNDNIYSVELKRFLNFGTSDMYKYDKNLYAFTIRFKYAISMYCFTLMIAEFGGTRLSVSNCLMFGLFVDIKNTLV